MLTFFRWARAEGYTVDPRILELKRPKVPEKEPTVYHVRQVRDIQAACNPKVPQEDLVVRLLVGSGVRASEVCGLALIGPDAGLDGSRPGRAARALGRGREGEEVAAGADHAQAGGGGQTLRGAHRPEVEHPHLLINERGEPYQRFGIDAIMDRLKEWTGFRVHAHAFRHTFATMATKLGWNFEHLRAAMGHSDYKVLQRYVRLAAERDLGPRRDWLELIVASPVAEWM